MCISRCCSRLFSRAEQNQLVLKKEVKQSGKKRGVSPLNDRMVVKEVDSFPIKFRTKLNFLVHLPAVLLKHSQIPLYSTVSKYFLNVMGTGMTTINALSMFKKYPVRCFLPTMILYNVIPRSEKITDGYVFSTLLTMCLGVKLLQEFASYWKRTPNLNKKALFTAVMALSPSCYALMNRLTAISPQGYELMMAPYNNMMASIDKLEKEYLNHNHRVATVCKKSPIPSSCEDKSLAIFIEEAYKTWPDGFNILLPRFPKKTKEVYQQMQNDNSEQSASEKFGDYIERINFYSSPRPYCPPNEDLSSQFWSILGLDSCNQAKSNYNSECRGIKFDSQSCLDAEKTFKEAVGGQSNQQQASSAHNSQCAVIDSKKLSSWVKNEKARIESSDLNMKCEMDAQVLLTGNTQKTSCKEIKKTYRELSLKYHPDKAKGSEKAWSEKFFPKITQANELLINKWQC